MIFRAVFSTEAQYVTACKPDHSQMTISFLHCFESIYHSSRCTSKSAMKVLIVGAGPSGLVALKEMRELGIEAFAVDSGDEIGGVFARSSKVTYEKLYLTIPNMFMAFSDFPPKDTNVKYWSKDEYTDYLESYADHFGLKKFIRLNTSVEEAKLIDSGNLWEVSTSSSNKTTKENCDYLIVATGANHIPHLPHEVFDGFTGKLMHSSEYRGGSQVRGQRVLVVGMGESAVDVAASAADTAKKSTIWNRHFPDMAPRFVTEFMTNPKYDEEKYLATGQNNLLPKDCLECITTSRIVRNLPLGVWGLCLHGFVNDMKARHGEDSHGAAFCDIHENTWERDYFSADTAQIPCKSGVLYRRACDEELDMVIAPTFDVNEKTVTFRNPRFYGHRCTSKDVEKKSIEVDIIIASTGYKLDFGWLKAEISPKPRTWFKHCFPPNLGNRLAFLGYARPHQGGIPQAAEMLSRYIGQMLVGNVSLPEDYASIAKVEGENEAACFHCMSHYELVVDYHAFMMSVASMIGCEPKMPHDVSGIVKHWTFPLWPCFFRMQGPGANPEACDCVLNKFGTFDGLGPMPLLLVEIACTFATPFLNLFNSLFGGLCDLGKNQALPRWYKWRMSKGFFLYSNQKLFDISVASRQFVAGIAMTLHLVSSSLIQLKAKTE